MAEKEPLLSRPQSSSYYSQSSQTRQKGPLKFCHSLFNTAKKVEDGGKRAWILVVKWLHGREFFAEFLATFVLVTFGNGAVAQTVLSGELGQSIGNELTINIGYGFGVMLGCYVAIGITGAHMNPAVTLAMALRGKTAWVKVIPYCLAQFLGAFVSSAVVYGVYIDALLKFKCNDSDSVKTPLCTGKIWATYPTPGLQLSLANGFLDQVIGTFLLLLGIWAICDAKNSEPKAGLKPLIIGLLVWAIGGSFGYNCGYAINPARDLGPRVFTALAGWGKDVFVCSSCSIRHWWWVPIVAPMVGAVLATLVYWLLIEAHHPPPSEVHAREHPFSLKHGPVNSPFAESPSPTFEGTGVTKRSSPTFQ